MKVNFSAMRHVVEGVQPLVPKGGAIAIISSNAGLQFMDHMEIITELLATDGYGGANAWCESHQDLVAEGYTFSKEAIIVYTMKRARSRSSATVCGSTASAPVRRRRR